MNCALLAALKESASTRRGKAEAKELPFVSAFLFFLGGGRGFYLRSVAFLCVVLRTRNCRRQTLSQTLSNPTAREMWRHCFARAKRRKFKICVFRVRVSVAQICKFERKKLRRSIFVIDEADLNFTTGATSSVVTE